MYSNEIHPLVGSPVLLQPRTEFRAHELKEWLNATLAWLDRKLEDALVGAVVHSDEGYPGTGEGALFFGSGNSQIATLVERQTRYVMLVKVASKDTQTVVGALVRHARKLPQELYKSLTWDRGKEALAEAICLLTDALR